MNKTPEQMAEEYLRYENESYYWAKHAFLAGYQAARSNSEGVQAAKDQLAEMRNHLEKAFQAGHLFMATGVDFDEWYAMVFLAKQQLADVGKVMNSSNNSNGWISVKERLPIFRCYNQNDESGYTENVLMHFVWGRIRISNFEKVDGVVSTSYGNHINEVTYWMPLPEPPEDR